MKKYPIIEPPSNLDFRNMPKVEIKKHYDWIMENIPKRIDVLVDAIQSTKGFEDWRADNSVKSLEKLGAWFSENVKTRPYTKAEKKRIQEGSKGKLKDLPVEGGKCQRSCRLVLRRQPNELQHRN